MGQEPANFTEAFSASVTMENFASIIIPVSDDAQPVQRCIEKVLKQDFPKKEIVLAVGQGVKEPPQVSTEAASVRLIRDRKSRGIAHLINAGMRAAKGNIRVLLRPNCVPAGEQWLSEMVSPLEDESVGVVVSQCRMADRKQLGLFSRLMNSINHPERLDGGARRLQAVSHLCDAYRASMLAEVGYFEEALFPTPGEAIDISVKVAGGGYQILLSPKAVVYYHAPANETRFRHVLASSFNYGYADGALGKRYGVGWLDCGVFAAALLSLLLVPLGFVSLPLAWIGAAGLLFWGWFLPFRLPFLPWSWPVGLLGIAAYAALVLGIRDDWAPVFLGRLHPAIIRQWCFLAAMTISYLLVVARQAGACFWESLIKDKSLLYSVAVFFLAGPWWLVSGVGYLKALLLARVPSE